MVGVCIIQAGMLRVRPSSAVAKCLYRCCTGTNIAIVMTYIARSGKTSDSWISSAAVNQEQPESSVECYQAALPG